MEVLGFKITVTLSWNTEWWTRNATFVAIIITQTWSRDYMHPQSMITLAMIPAQHVPEEFTEGVLIDSWRR